MHLHRRARCRRHSPETGRRDRAPVRRAIPAATPAKAKPWAKATAAAVISSQRAASKKAMWSRPMAFCVAARLTSCRLIIAHPEYAAPALCFIRSTPARSNWSRCGRPTRSKLIRNPDIRNRGAPIRRHRTHNFRRHIGRFRPFSDTQPSRWEWLLLPLTGHRAGHRVISCSGVTAG